MLFISPPFGNYLTFLPYTTPIKGSFTIKPRDGLLTQIIQTLHYSTLYKGWMNKIGLKNAGIDYAVDKYKYNSILSLAILQKSDIEYFYKKVPFDANIEINISCPNEKVYTAGGIHKLLNGERRWCIIKLAPLDSHKKIDDLYTQGFRQFHCCNTYPLPLGGLSGPFLFPFVEEKIKYLKNTYPDCEVIAGGGIQSMQILNKYKSLGTDHFSISSLCFNPIKFSLFYINYLLNK